MANTARLLLPYPLLSSSADLPQWLADLAAILDSIVLVYGGQGTLAARPVSTPGSPGVQGRVYRATDTGEVFWDSGTAWFAIGSVTAGSVGTAQLVDLAVTTAKLAALAVTTGKLADNSVTSAKIVDGTITAADIAAALFPSQGAGGGTEAFRAIGAAAGQVVAGNDPRIPTYGSAFPGSGLVNGYRFALFIADPVGGNIALDCIYRADLDGTYPWAVAMIPITLFNVAGVHTTAPENVIADVITFTAPRSGVYKYHIVSGATTNGSGPVHRTNINGSAGSWVSSSLPFAGETVLGAGQTFKVQHSNDFGNISLSDTNETCSAQFWAKKVV